MRDLEDFGLDVNERGDLVCPPCETASIRPAGPVHILALRTIHAQDILLMVDDALYAALRQAFDGIAHRFTPTETVRASDTTRATQAGNGPIPSASADPL